MRRKAVQDAADNTKMVLKRSTEPDIFSVWGGDFAVGSGGSGIAQATGNVREQVLPGGGCSHWFGSSERLADRLPVIVFAVANC